MVCSRCRIQGHIAKNCKTDLKKNASNKDAYNVEYLGFDDSDEDEQVKFSDKNLKGHTLNKL